jgi:hypothetical protein
MSSATAVQSMAKSKAVLTRIYEDALDDARTAASFREMALVDYLTMVIKEAADRDIDEGYARRKQSRKKPISPPAKAG